MKPCNELPGVVERLSHEQPLPEHLLAHVATCDHCARASAGHLLDRCPAQHPADEDEAVLASVGLAATDIAMRLDSERLADPDFAADWKAIEDLHAPRAPGAAPTRRTRATTTWLAAAGLLIAVIGGAAAIALRPTVPESAGLLPRGDDPAPRFELAIGEPMRFCQPDGTCRWNARIEPLVVHYRGRAIPLRVTIHDALGDRSQLFPDSPESFMKPTVHPCPSDQWCVVDGGLYSAPVGPARLCVETRDTASPRPCFNLEVID